jgi:two-component system, NtrC family, nitrogen regulation sensor histidine kinase GlnL
VPAEHRILLLSRRARLEPVFRRIAAERSLRFVRAADARSACERLQTDGISCALIDLDDLGDAAEELVRRMRGLRPQLHTLGFGNASPGTARIFDVPPLRKPLQIEDLERALDGFAHDGGAGRPVTEAARIHAGGSQEELRRRIGQLTTLYQIGRAISESRNWSEALDYFLATLRDYLGVRGAAILLWSREATVLLPRTVLSLDDAAVQDAVATLRAAYPVHNPTAEIHALECWRTGELRCSGHTGEWDLTALPLSYRRTPLGFLILEKSYAGGADFASELFFLQTIQTILGEEVANAVHLSRLVDLKNFNEAVLDNVESGVLTATERGAITFANRLARQTLGLEGPGLEPGLQVDDLFEMGGEPAFERLRRGGDESATRNAEVRRRDGRRVPVQIRTRTIVNPSDSEPLVVVAFEDLTAQRLLEEQVRRADRLRSLGQLSAAIAHEVRNPLQGISLTLSNLQEHLLPGAEPYVRVIFSEVERLNNIVGGILSFARPAPPIPVEVSLRGLCARAIELASERAAQLGVRFVLRPPPEDDRGEMDEGQILQVLLNLLLNAVDASPPDSAVEISIERVTTRLVQAAAGDGPAWRIQVRDSGPGVSPEVRDKMFDPFFTTKSEGTGLGLAVCQKIVEEHRGSIHVEAASGAGTTFTVELPLRFEGTAAWPARD